MQSPRVQLLTDRLPSGPWIYARQVRVGDPAPEPGDLVEVYDASERFIGHGLFNANSDITLRMLSRGRKSAMRRPREFVAGQLRLADRLRRRTLRLDAFTDAYRVVHAEGDDLPGLVVDRLGSTLVCEYHALGFWRLRADVEAGLRELYPEAAVRHRVPDSAVRVEGFEPPQHGGDPVEPIEIREYGLAFEVLPGEGHKTGWFCDQRENRARIATFAKGRDVLDLCCNAGGFALHAARAGARRVRAVDLDEKVLARARASALLNGLEVGFRHQDAFATMREVQRELRLPELVVLDPHKIIRGKRELERGLSHYLDLNALALGCVAPGGLLATFSCSGAVDLAAFLGVVFQAARRAERQIRVLEILGAAADHPQRPDFQRSRYLKGALLAVD